MWSAERKAAYAALHEQWLPVVGYEGLYEVSSLGRVRSVDRNVLYRGAKSHLKPLGGRVLVQWQARTGYRYVGLRRDKVQTSTRVHRMVLEAFVGCRPDEHECRHLNGHPGDNRLVNLVWGTKVENMADQFRHGTRLNNKGSRNACAKLDEDKVRDIRACFGRESHRSIARRYGVSPSVVNNIARGLRWAHVDAR